MLLAFNVVAMLLNIFSFAVTGSYVSAFFAVLSAVVAGLVHWDDKQMKKDQ